MRKFMSEIQFFIGRRSMRSYSSWGTRSPLLPYESHHFGHKIRTV